MYIASFTFVGLSAKFTSGPLENEFREGQREIHEDEEEESGGTTANLGLASASPACRRPFDRH